MQKNGIFKLIFLFLVCLVLPEQIFSQGRNIESLTGVKSLTVLIEGLESDLEQTGITKEQIQTVVEIKLRLAKIRVESSENNFTPYAMLYINIGSLNTDKGGFSLSIDTSLEQFVNLRRDKSISFLTSTWRTKSTAYIAKQNIREIKDLVSDQIDMFINDYLKANAIIQKQNDNLPDLSKYEVKKPPTSATKEKDSPFTATYVGGNRPPTVEIFNDSNRTMYFDFGQGKTTAYVIPSGGSQKITITEGKYNFKASAPRVRSDEGQEMFNNGYVYTWRFYIVTVPR